MIYCWDYLCFLKRRKGNEITVFLLVLLMFTGVYSCFIMFVGYLIYSEVNQSYVHLHLLFFVCPS